MKSISGTRGTIGGKPGDNLTPLDIVGATAAYAALLLEQEAPARVVVGRDARLSGAMVQGLVVNTLLAMGVDVIDLGLSTTPTVEMAVVQENAGGGIILTASHNPREWNALKFLNQKGEFISAQAGARLLALQANQEMVFATIDQLGKYQLAEYDFQQHWAAILAYPLVDVDAIRRRKFHVVLDPVNSTGALAIPPLLAELGVTCELVNGEPTGQFAHNPEPLPEHLTDLIGRVVAAKADLGIAVDPDVDRLAFVCEDGSLFGEEYTLVAVADYILQQRPGNTVSNLSSTRALRWVTEKHGGQYFASAVGEVNVVEKMKAVSAVIGGEGNGGVIVPDLHYGRDALIGLVLFLSALATKGGSASDLRRQYPDWQMVKDKITLTPEIKLGYLLEQLALHYQAEDISTIDGLKIDFPNSWVHLRGSNTEPIIRIYAEAPSLAEAQALVTQIRQDVTRILGV